MDPPTDAVLEVKFYSFDSLSLQSSERGSVCWTCTTLVFSSGSPETRGLRPRHTDTHTHTPPPHVTQTLHHRYTHIVYIHMCHIHTYHTTQTPHYVHTNTNTHTSLPVTASHLTNGRRGRGGLRERQWFKVRMTGERK